MTHATPLRLSALILALFLASPAQSIAQIQSQTDPSTQIAPAQEKTSDLFRIDGKPPKSGHFTRSDTPIPTDLLESEMFNQLAGHIATLEPRSFSALRRSINSKPVAPGIIDGLTESTILAYMHLERGDTKLTYEVHLGDSKFFVLRLTSDPTQTWSIQSKAFDRLDIDLNWPITTDTDLITAGSTRFEMPQPYIESATILDRRTIKARIKNRYPDLTRKPGDELYRVRLPKNYDPDSPAGILIWISPMTDGRIPKIFESVLDNLGLIAIGIDNNGNKRPITDRLQNHLDSIDTIAHHYRIDRSRIYLTGMSGGGRCSSILQIAFPELFAGAVPIVGLDTYHNAPTGDPGKFWPARLGRPASKWMRLLKTKRIAAITGSADFNEPEMSIRKELLKKDGIEMRLDIIEGMAHTMPTAGQFLSALTWVDEPHSKERETALKDAQELMDQFASKFGESDVDNPVARKLLIKTISLAPWSTPAWSACQLLGYPKPE